MFVILLRSNAPRRIGLGSDRVFLIFTDACFEPGECNTMCGVGGVLVDGCGTIANFFSYELCDKAKDLLGVADKKQCIYEAETLAATVAFHLWGPCIQGCKCVIFVDNEATKFALISAQGANDVVSSLTNKFALCEAEKQSHSWVARVASKSNIADDPSRGVCQPLLSMGACDDSGVVPDLTMNLLKRPDNLQLTSKGETS
ncbi:unnamed protein product [Effrenium voratum]|nr:unnamed protein product [Effrenium voratum]